MKRTRMAAAETHHKISNQKMWPPYSCLVPEAPLCQHPASSTHFVLHTHLLNIIIKILKRIPPPFSSSSSSSPTLRRQRTWSIRPSFSVSSLPISSSLIRPVTGRSVGWLAGRPVRGVSFFGYAPLIIQPFYSRRVFLRKPFWKFFFKSLHQQHHRSPPQHRK